MRAKDLVEQLIPETDENLVTADEVKPICAQFKAKFGDSAKVAVTLRSFFERHFGDRDFSPEAAEVAFELLPNAMKAYESEIFR